MAKRAAAVPDLDAIFGALAHPVRRRVIERLAAGEAGLSELAAPFGLSLPTMSRHLRVLERAGLVRVSRDWRVRRRSIDAAPLGAAFGWLTQYRVLWEQRLDRFGALLELPGASPPSENVPKGKKRT